MLKSSKQFDVSTFVSESNQVKKIPVNMLEPYHNHKFKLYSGERLEDMVESVRQNGILNPILVQPIKNTSKYEILSGHNRVESAKIAGLVTVPAIIKEHLSEDEAEIYVIETNLMQRGFNELSLSEQATVLQSRHSKLFSQGKRNDIIAELQSLEKGVTSLNKVGDEYGMSKNTVARLLRINYLIQPLKDLIDAKSMALRVGVELSYIPMDAQTMVYKILTEHSRKIDMKLSKVIRNLFATNENVPFETIENIIVSNKKPVTSKPIKISLNCDIYGKYFDSHTSKKEIESTIQKALEMYFKSNSIH